VDVVVSVPVPRRYSPCGIAKQAQEELNAPCCQAVTFKSTSAGIYATSPWDAIYTKGKVFERKTDFPLESFTKDREEA
jgi:hypothetical protein